MTNRLVRVPATSANIGPGFDCFGVALDLYNEVEYEVTGNNGEIYIEISGEGKNSLSKDKNNLIYHAFQKTFDFCGEQVPGIHMKQTNRIPLSRGLGSSSAAIISGIAIANNLLDDRLSNKEILKIATEIEGHPDNVAPALLGGFVISFKDEGEIITKKIPVPKEVAATVIVPNFRLSTKESRNILPKKVPLEDAVHNISRASLLVSSLLTEDYENLRLSFSDKIHQDYRASLIPGLLEVINEAKNLDILGIALSGAGPSIIVFHKKDVKIPIEGLIKTLEKNNVFSEIYHLEPVKNGTIIK